MRWAGRGNNNGVELRVLQDLIETRRRTHAWILDPHRIKFAFIQVTDITQIRLCQLRIVPGKVLAPTTNSDYRYFDHVFHSSNKLSKMSIPG
jgi:hypothetical protein